jgi:hypothetical protein
MADVTVASFEEMEPTYEGLARRARATLGVTAWGMQVLTLPPKWDGYPNHKHDAGSQDPNQEEVYVPLEGSGLLHADGQRRKRGEHLDEALLEVARAPPPRERSASCRTSMPSHGRPASTSNRASVWFPSGPIGVNAAGGVARPLPAA